MSTSKKQPNDICCRNEHASPNDLPPKRAPKFPPGLVNDPATLDHNAVYKMALLHCTIPEIASVLGVSKEVIQEKARLSLEKGWNEGKETLRRWQWAKAEEGNVPMLIWLGKQILQQRDRQPDEATQLHFNVVTNEVPIDRGEAIEVAKKEIEGKKKGK